MSSERGNIIVYLLVSLALFGSMLGGIWWVKNRIGSTSRTQSPAVTAPASNKTAQEKAPETVVDQDAAPTANPDNQSQNQSSTAGSNSNSASSQPSNTQAGSGSGATTMPPKDDVPTTSHPESQTSHKPSPSTVASSGPVEDTVMSALLLGIATFALHSFVRSPKSYRTM